MRFFYLLGLISVVICFNFTDDQKIQNKKANKGIPEVFLKVRTQANIKGDINSIPKKYIGPNFVTKSYTVKRKTYYPKIKKHLFETGIASWYHDSLHNNMTSNGGYYHKYYLTAAHKTLPLPSIVMVTNKSNGKSIKVLVNDRGPFVGKRIIDLSRKAAEELDFLNNGLAFVDVKYLHEETKDFIKNNLPESEIKKASQVFALL